MLQIGKRATAIAAMIACARQIYRTRLSSNGIHQHMLNPADPWPEGCHLSDT
jgi:proline racemase